jgi:8-oxo-dGTP diphosphatase
MAMSLEWEFAGEKMRPHESQEEWVRRDLAEESGLQARIDGQLPPSSHRCPTFKTTLYASDCSIQSGEMNLHERSGAVLLRIEEQLPLGCTNAGTQLINAYCIDLNRAVT